MWQHPRTLQLVLLLSLAGGAIDAAELERTNERIRLGDERIVQVFDYGMARSPSFRELVATFDVIDRTVDLKHGACEPGVCSHVVPLVTATNLLIRVDSQQPLHAAVGQLAHGLYHALEIGREPGVRDNESSRKLFGRIGEWRCRDESDACWETRAATAFEALVMRELAGLEPALPSNVQFTDSGTQHVAGELLRASPTFRRQCAIVDAMERLVVVVGDKRRTLSSLVRARTELRRYSTGLVVAVVEFPSLTNPSMLAHELEHVLEYVEGFSRASVVGGPAGGSNLHGRAGDSKRVRAAERAAMRELAAADPLSVALERVLKLRW